MPAIGAPYDQFRLHLGRVRHAFHELRKRLAMLWDEQRRKILPRQLIKGDTRQGGQRTVGIKHQTLRVQGSRAFLHLLDQQPVRLLGPLPGEQRFVARTADKQRIHLATANGLQRLLIDIQHRARRHHRRLIFVLGWGGILGG